MGTLSTVNALAVRPNGDLIAAGGGGPSGFVSRWNGTTWITIGAVSNPVTASVNALAVMPDGSVVAAGLFSSIAGRPVNDIARWDGTSWSEIGTGLVGISARAFAVTALSNGDIVVGGEFFTNGGFITHWNGSTWGPLGAGVNNAVYTLASLPSRRGGEVIVGGSFDMAGGAPATRFARYTLAGIPWIAQEPRAASACRGGVFTPRVDIAPGYEPLLFQWRKNGVPLADGPTSTGGVIAGATAATLSISGAATTDAGAYDCVITNACGTVSSAAAGLTICAADFNCDGGTDSRDFFEFLAAFFAGDLAADIDADGTVTSDDFGDFIVALFEGGQGC